MSLEEKKRLAAEQQESFKNRNSNDALITESSIKSSPKIDLNWEFNSNNLRSKNRKSNLKLG